MRKIQSKTLTPLLMLRILEEYSDEKHPLTREEIERILDEEYGITMERKAFFRHIEHLTELEDLDIRRVTVKPKDTEKNACAGFFLADRKFTEMELRVIVDALSGSHYLSQWETEDLVRRLAGLSTRQFRKKMSSYQFIGCGSKTENKTLMLNLEIIDEAIAEHKRIRITRLCYQNDGTLAESETSQEICTPLRYFVKEGEYLLMAIHDWMGEPEITSYSLSRVANVEKTDFAAEDVRSIPKYKNGINWQTYLREHPITYLSQEKPVLCTFLCLRWMLEEMKIRFGDELRIRQLSAAEKEAIGKVLEGPVKKDWLIEVSVITDPFVAKQFAWENPNDVWLTGPEEFRKRLHRQFEVKQKRYEQLWDSCGLGISK